MSLSDKFYEGLSAPLPVAGAQMPTDLVLYAGGPLDALKQHEQKYKQLDYLNRLSDKASKKMLKQLADAETDYGEEDMDKVSFIGSDPLSRRAYYLQKLAEPAATTPVLESVQPPPVLESVQPPPVLESVQPPPVLESVEPPATPTPLYTPAESLKPEEVNAVETRNKQLGLPSLYGTTREERDAERAMRLEPAGPPIEGAGPSSYLGPGRRELGNSGQTLDTIDRFARRYNQSVPSVAKSTEPVDERSMYQRFTDGLYHYGTRAARGLSTGAQMGASYLYDKAQANKYLDPDTILGGALDYYGQRGSLADQMARVNASLAHSYGRDERDPSSKLYADRLRRIDVDPRAVGMQTREDLLDRGKFKNQVLEDQMSVYRDRGYTPEQMAEMRGSASRVFDNYYGVQGNQAGTPLIRDDLDGTSLTQGIVDLGDSIRSGFRRAQDFIGADPIVAPRRATIRAAELQEMMGKDPAIMKRIQNAYGDAAAKLNMPLADYAAQRMASDFSLESPNNPQVQEKPEERAARFATSRDLVTGMVETMPEEQRLSFIQKVNPQAISRAQEISSLVDTNPEEAIKQINTMDPEQARYMLDFLQEVSPYVLGGEGQVAPRIDPKSFEVRADRDDFFPSLGGVDIVNPALQAVGGGGDLDQMTGDSRRSVYGFNSMHDLPASEGRYYLVDDGNLINSYYNPVTGDVVRKLFTDMGNLKSRSTYNTNEALPQQYHKQFQQQHGYLPTYTGR